jgi:hypothetical protein
VLVVELDVDVVVKVLSQPEQVRSHCFAIEIDEHSPTPKSSSHVARGKILALFAQFCGVGEAVVLVEVEVDVEVEVVWLHPLHVLSHWTPNIAHKSCEKIV